MKYVQWNFSKYRNSPLKLSYICNNSLVLKYVLWKKDEETT